MENLFIPAYDFTDYFLFGYDIDSISKKQYIKDTVITSNYLEVKKQIILNTIYSSINLTKETKNVINYILNNEDLLKKTKIVSDASYRNSCILFGNECFLNGNDYLYSDSKYYKKSNDYNILDKIKYYEKYAETLFIMFSYRKSISFGNFLEYCYER